MLQTMAKKDDIRDEEWSRSIFKCRKFDLTLFNFKNQAYRYLRLNQ